MPVITIDNAHIVVGKIGAVTGPIETEYGDFDFFDPPEGSENEDYKVYVVVVYVEGYPVEFTYTDKKEAQKVVGVVLEALKKEDK